MLLTKGGGEPKNKSGGQKHCVRCRFHDGEKLRIEKHAGRSAVFEREHLLLADCKKKKMDRYIE
jgi:hypothetical protein